MGAEFWKRPNCVWTAIKPLKAECQTVEQTRRFIALSLAKPLKVWSICVQRVTTPIWPEKSDVLLQAYHLLLISCT